MVKSLFTMNDKTKKNVNEVKNNNKEPEHILNLHLQFFICIYIDVYKVVLLDITKK